MRRPDHESRSHVTVLPDIQLSSRPVFVSIISSFYSIIALSLHGVVLIHSILRPFPSYHRPHGALGRALIIYMYMYMHMFLEPSRLQSSG
jgi:hypothetical protein